MLCLIGQTDIERSTHKRQCHSAVQDSFDSGGHSCSWTPEDLFEINKEERAFCCKFPLKHWRGHPDHFTIVIDKVTSVDCSAVCLSL